ncbi:helix-turn-helix transcriptional regulator [Bdellovibrionota bacterium FG-2]
MPAKSRKEVEWQIRGLLALIQKRREKLGMTQEEFAEKLDISARTLQFIEQGRRFPSLPMLFHLLKTLGVSARFE